MKTRIFVVALALVCAASATHAVTLNPKGLGQVLIFPYYTVNKGQDTLISVVNTGDLGSVVNVHVKEGMNGREVSDFNLFLSPHDAWTARISQLANDGGAALFTNDHSCTFPPVGSAGAPFRSSAYAGGGAFPADGGPTTVRRTREGSIELMEMGAIIAGSDLDDAITHVQNGTPNAGAPACLPAVIGTPGLFVTAPAGHLFGSASIVNVGEGTFFSYNAEALAGFTDIVLFSGSSQLVPTLHQANSPGSTYPGGAIAHVVADSGDLLALDYANGIDAVSAVFMADAIYNEYLVAAGIGANTDWVVTFPTKSFYVDTFYNPTTVVPPFHELFHAPGASNVEIGVAVFDQEEATSDEYVSGFPPPPLPPLPYQVNVISFHEGAAPGAPSSVLGSSLSWNFAPYGPAGWAAIGLASGDTIGHHLRPAAHGEVLNGLPVTGFMVYNLINANAAPGKLANYGGSYVHRSTVSCTSGSTAAACP